MMSVRIHQHLPLVDGLLCSISCEVDLFKDLTLERAALVFYGKFKAIRVRGEVPPTIQAAHMEHLNFHTGFDTTFPVTFFSTHYIIISLDEDSK